MTFFIANLSNTGQPLFTTLRNFIGFLGIRCVTLVSSSPLAKISLVATAAFGFYKLYEHYNNPFNVTRRAGKDLIDSWVNAHRAVMDASKSCEKNDFNASHELIQSMLVKINTAVASAKKYTASRDLMLKIAINNKEANDLKEGLKNGIAPQLAVVEIYDQMAKSIEKNPKAKDANTSREAFLMGMAEFFVPNQEIIKAACVHVVPKIRTAS